MVMRGRYGEEGTCIEHLALRILINLQHFGASENGMGKWNGNGAY